MGGAERWYRNLGAALAAAGHEVTYLTLRQWDGGVDASYSGVTVKAVGPRMALYVEGRRRILPPLVFGAGVLWHLLRHRRAYDVVHTASFPYFSLLAAGLVRPRRGYHIVVDWHEVWSRDYWREYLGSIGGTVGLLVQRLCARIPQRAFCFSRLHRDRLKAEGLRGEVTVLEGEYAGDLTPPEPRPAEPFVVFAGRHIPEKRAQAIVPAIAEARRELPELTARIFGDGPERGSVLAAIAAEGLERHRHGPRIRGRRHRGRVAARGAVHGAPLGARGLRAGRGRGVRRRDPDRGGGGSRQRRGGAGGLRPERRDRRLRLAQDLAAAIVEVERQGQALRERTCEWFAEHAERLSLQASLDRVLAMYEK